MKISVLILFLSIFLFAVSVVKIEAQQEQQLTLPDSTMSEVVTRILKWKFQSTKRLRTVRILGTNIKTEWLPNIRNVTFEIVTEETYSRSNERVYFFKEPVDEKTFFSIDLGFGDPECDATGDTWHFRIKDEKVRLWKPANGWGQGCGSGNASKKVLGWKIGEVSPNELPGFDFRFNF